MAAHRTYTPELLPQEAVPEPLAGKGLYRPTGYMCWQCDFTTKKRGFPGRQAIRAHIKVHKRDKRAWMRPLVRQTLVVAGIAGLAVMGWFSEALSLEVPFTTPVATLPPAITGWATVSVAAFLLVVAAYLLSVSGVDGGKPLARALSGLVVAGSLGALWGVVLAWEVVAVDVFWAMLVPMGLLLALTPIKAAQAGKVQLLVRRRKVRPASYTSLMEPKSREALDRIRTWWQNTALSRPKRARVSSSARAAVIEVVRRRGPSRLSAAAEGGRWPARPQGRATSLLSDYLAPLPGGFLATGPTGESATSPCATSRSTGSHER